LRGARYKFDAAKFLPHLSREISGDSDLEKAPNGAQKKVDKKEIASPENPSVLAGLLLLPFAVRLDSESKSVFHAAHTHFPR
jgi:hypothetical protein